MTAAVETLDPSTLSRVIAFIVLGAMGTYLILPHGHGLAKPALAHRVGYVLVGLAVVIFATFWRAPVEYVTWFFFYAFGLMSILGGILTVTNRNPIYSALWFASVVLSTAGLFLLSGAQFLAAGTVIVYAGAIIVTFLFVIMLAQMEGRAIYDRTARSPFWATFSSFLLLFGLTYALLGLRPSASNPRKADGDRLAAATTELIPASRRLSERESPLLSKDQATVLARTLPPTSALPEADPKRRAAGHHVAGLGATLYTEHLVTVELVGALLFAALIGALAIAAPRAPIRPATHDAAANAGV